MRYLFCTAIVATCLLSPQSYADGKSASTLQLNTTDLVRHPGSPINKFSPGDNAGPHSSARTIIVTPVMPSSISKLIRRFPMEQIHPGILTDDDGRPTTDVRSEELLERIGSDLTSHQCDLISPNSNLNLVFNSSLPVEYIERNQTFLVKCSKGSKFRFSLFENGLAVDRLTIGMYPADGEALNGLAHLHFLMPDRSPASGTTFISDGEVHAISLISLLVPSGSKKYLSGDLKEMGESGIHLIVE